MFLGLIGQVKEVVPHLTPENCLEAPSNKIHKLTQNLAIKLKKLSKLRKGIPIMLGAFFFLFAFLSLYTYVVYMGGSKVLFP